MDCRAACGACCIAPSINEPFYGMPRGKPAGVSCVHLDESMACRMFHDPRRPAVCTAFAPELAVCGDDREQALAIITELELATEARA